MYTVIKKARFDCPWCDKAIALLEEKGLEHRVRALGNSKLREEADKAGMNTIPIIYDGDVLVGGYDALAKHLEGN